MPRALLRSDAFSYGVYSFEPGSAKHAAELERRDLLAVAAFATGLHAVGPDARSRDLPPAADASFSVADQLWVIDSRLRAFEAFAAGPAAYDELRDLCHGLDLRARITDLIARATAGLGDDDQATVLPRSAWRLNIADLGPQNLLFTADGGLTVVDFEAAGWDDPARLVMGFVAHATSEDLPHGGVQTFLAAYAEARALSSAEIARFERVGMLYDVEWIAIYATALTAEAVAAKRFASRAFDQHAYLAGAIAKLQRRLARATEGAGYQFQAG